ncbi:MAG TPA: di-heme oxidoredictase family protein [Bryobacteraceae bacterium]|nr:di-heme oxidoredictase family protein [Bryobacteraceae bacterium]
MKRFWRNTWVVAMTVSVWPLVTPAQIGSEKAILKHLRDGEEFEIELDALLKHGEALFSAAWTIQEGGGRPLTKGTGAALSDPSSPLVFPRNFNRISAPDANSCLGCHAVPRVGGGGDVVTNVFVLGQRFDFATFDAADPSATRGSRDELGRLVSHQSIANERATVGMFGAGYIEMLAREMTTDLQTLRDSLAPGQSVALVTKGVRFGVLSRFTDGRWDTSKVEGLPAFSLTTQGASSPPNLIIRPFHQAGRVVSLREFSNNAFNHHHGIQSTERFGSNTDPDRDGFGDEMTRADVTAVSLFQAALAVPGRVIPRDPAVRQAIRLGEQRFASIGCATCHTPSLPLSAKGRIYTEPNPFNPTGNLRVGEAPTFSMDLSDPRLPQPRLQPDRSGITHVPAFTDLKLHDICNGPDDPNGEPLDMQHAAGSQDFFAGNRKFLTKRLWGSASEPPYFHHGKFTTLREAVLAHAGEALESRKAFEALLPHEHDAIIEFLKSLRILEPGAKAVSVSHRIDDVVGP